MTNTPTPEAIVKAALERAAATLTCGCEIDCQGGAQCMQPEREDILALASDQAEVAQIIQNAGGQNDTTLYAVGYDVGFEDGFADAVQTVADRIEELEGKLAKAKAVSYQLGMETALKVIASIGYGKNKDVDCGHDEAFRAVNAHLADWKAATLAELEGEK